MEKLDRQQIKAIISKMRRLHKEKQTKIYNEAFEKCTLSDKERELLEVAEKYQSTYKASQEFYDKFMRLREDLKESNINISRTIHPSEPVNEMVRLLKKNKVEPISELDGSMIEEDIVLSSLDPDKTLEDIINNFEKYQVKK